MTGGLRGDSPLSADDAFAAGDAARTQRQALEGGPLRGDEHPNAWQISIVMGIVAATIATLLERGLMPAIPSASWWRACGEWLVSTACIYFGLKAIPDWMSGSIMGLGLGGTAAYVGWLLFSPRRAVGLGIGVGALMYLAFSSPE